MSHISTSFKPAERDMREWICVVVIVVGSLHSIPKSDTEKNALPSIIAGEMLCSLSYLVLPILDDLFEFLSKGPI